MPISIFCQIDRTRSWYFGEGLKIFFTKDNQLNVKTGLNGVAGEGSGVFNDSSGNLLFYSDCCRMYDSNNSDVCTNFTLGSNGSSSQSSILTSVNDSILHIFSTSSVIYNTGFKNGGFNYSKYDIIEKKWLIKAMTLEKYSAETQAFVNHQNGKWQWVVRHSRLGDTLYSYLLTEKGLETCPVISHVGPFYDDWYPGQGKLKFSAAFPTKIRTKARIVNPSNPKYFFTDCFTIDLYDDDNYEKPKWFVHPTHDYNVDVIAIPFANRCEIPPLVRIFPINEYEFDNDFEIEVSDDVFILGYPFDLTGGKELPIWKRGTISTEPILDLDNLPKFLVDTATRSGMSGSPVIMQRNGFHRLNDKEVTSKDILGRIRLFAGIYSGRIGAENNFETQLGIVWKQIVIEEIINGQKLGGIDFQKI